MLLKHQKKVSFLLGLVFYYDTSYHTMINHDIIINRLREAVYSKVDNPVSGEASVARRRKQGFQLSSYAVKLA